MSFIDERISIQRQDILDAVSAGRKGKFALSSAVIDRVLPILVEEKVRETRADVDGIKILSHQYNVTTDDQDVKVRIFLKD